ncbi:MAG: M20 family metallo-hydrolase [Spirochaetaceae bacterium]|jgi:succinyl-diaminopimelate desuccinylase|nr:M20 family metallo-hydrolase [Spirochaetaceae bacterium]
MSDRERLFAFIDGCRETAVELEREMCARPAVSPVSDGEGELDKALYIEDFLRKNGITDIERIDAPAPEAKGGVRPNVVATIPGKNDEARLWVISHLDVVPPGDPSLWTGNPWELAVDGDVLTGRGVEDNQQGICSSVIAALAFVKNSIVPERTIKLLFVADEENGSEYGIGHLMRTCPSLFRPSDMALIPDSGNAEGSEIEIAEKNILWLKIVVEGKQAHGSRPDLGVNAHRVHAELVCALQTLSARFSATDSLFDPPYSSFEPTKIEANVPNVNTIPGSSTFYMDCRVLPCYPLKEVFLAFGSIFETIEKKHRVKIRFYAEQMQESPATQADSPLIKRLSRSIASVLGVTPKLVGIGGGTVAAYLRRAGVDSAVWSKLGGNAHKTNESALVPNILAEAKVMTDLLLGNGC